MPSTIDYVAPYHPNEYVQTALTGNRVSRKATILGSQNIILGGKCIIQHGAIIRGDLKRITPSSHASGTANQLQPIQSVAVYIGRYCLLAESTVIRPPYKTYKGIFSYYPMKVSDHVSVGANTVLEAASVGSHVEIGANCLVGRFVIIKDCARILDGSVVAPNTVIPSFSIFAGSPAKQVGELPETFAESCEAKMKDFYQRFRPAHER
ncbi:probable dynactin Arp1 p25 subunit RO12 [Melanopsichium pennsylvanicum]|uniref:Dynactin subunit 5 n=1 Tax=Melanopsichium pennsylvanicum TaxID=63383 RepID=A0AAJ4XK66_9BASI|nr:probable dynactin Arp1 p25 subunit RO12 [Melanopsichium pennsylvanicum]